MTRTDRLDTHARPPEKIRLAFKKYQKLKTQLDFDLDPGIVDPVKLIEVNQDGPHWRRRAVSGDHEGTFDAFVLSKQPSRPRQVSSEKVPLLAFESLVIPGLYVFPALFPPNVQLKLLENLFHRDLSNPNHSTNVHLHHHVSYPDPSEIPSKSPGKSMPLFSFFTVNPSLEFLPKDPPVHKPISVRAFLEKKLRWMTLGGQYNWTSKSYPSVVPPAFPSDLKMLLQGLFPDMEPQAAIVNLYSPGDTLSVHRDVSEDSDRGLVSVSLGCDGIFLICNDKTEEVMVLRLRSGDTVYMAEEARFAWHGVPKVLSGTCPKWLQNWPGDCSQETRESWQGWMANKRINLNVRQMADDKAGSAAE